MSHDRYLNRVRGAACWFAAVAAVAVLASPSVAQTEAQVGAQGGQASAGEPRHVDLRTLPTGTGRAPSAPQIVPRPRNGVSDSEWSALKKGASQKIGAPVSEAIGLEPARPSTSDAAETPGAIININ